MKLLTGGTAKTTNCQLEFCWECGVDSFNRRMERSVSEWIAKNEKTLNKKLPHQAVQLLMEEFPDLRYVEAKDYAFRMAKGGR
jgi:hypothetical protein